MSDPSARTFSSDFKRFFVRGLVVVLPTILTLWIVVKAYQFVDSAIAEPINQSVRVAMANAAPHWELIRDNFDPKPADVQRALDHWKVAQEIDPAATDLDAAVAAAGIQPPTYDQMLARLRVRNIKLWWESHWYMDLIGLIVAVIGVYIAGRLLGGYLGRRVYRKIERVITSLPVVKQVYPYVKQIVDFLFGDDKKMKFNRVVMIQYPSRGLWSLGFQTGPSLPRVDEQVGESVTVYLPSAPTPFTGYTVCVPCDEVVELPITVEEALRYIISGGVLAPDKAKPLAEARADLIPIPIPALDEPNGSSGGHPQTHIAAPAVDRP